MGPALTLTLALVTLAGCSGPVATPSASTPAPATSASATGSPTGPRTAPDGRPFVVEELDQFDEPWAMAFLPGGELLITDRGGSLHLRAVDGRTVEIGGVPKVVHDGQGGLGDVIASPGFASDRTVYLSWVEPGEGGTGAVVGRARLAGSSDAPELTGLRVIWRQQPKTSGSGHFGHRLAFSPDGAYLFVSSGERQKFDPAQDLGTNLGKILRLNPDGSPAAGNPWADQGGVTAEVWTRGHRNPLGLAFDPAGNLWSTEMGPQGGDELNLIEAGRNYGWPRASNGSHYGGGDIPDHRDGDGFAAPAAFWNPSISPGSLLVYTGDAFPHWRGDAFIGALSGEALVRVDLSGTTATEGDTWPMGQRIREVEQAPDGSIWLLEDTPGGRLLRLAPPS